MSKAILVAAKDIKGIFSNNKKMPLILVTILIVSFFMAKGMSGFFSQGVYIDRFDIVVVNSDSHPLSRVLVEQFSKDKNLLSLLNINVVNEEKQAEELVRQQKAVAAVIIPPGFVDSVEIGENYPIKLITNSAHPLKEAMIKSLMESYVKSVSAGQSAVNAVWDYYEQTDMSYQQRRQKIDRVITEITLKALSRNSYIDSTIVEGINSTSPSQYYLASIIIVVLMFMTLSLSRGIIEEGNNKVIDRITLSSISKGSYILGKFLGIFISGVIVILITYTLGSVFMGSYISWNYWHTIVLLTSTHFALCGIALAIASIVKSAAIMEMGGNVFIFTMAIIGGGVIPYIYLPPIIAAISPFTINYWALRAFMDFSGNNVSQGYQSIFMLLTFGFISIGLSITLFNKRRGLVS